MGADRSEWKTIAVIFIFWTTSRRQYFPVQKTEFNTPNHEQKELFSKIKPLSDGFAIRVPISGKIKSVCQYSALELPTGNIFISGGVLCDAEPESESLKLTWLFYPRTKKLIQGPSLHFGRSDHCLTLLRDGHTYQWRALTRVSSFALHITVGRNI